MMEILFNSIFMFKEGRGLCIGGSRGHCWRTPPQQDPILSFSHNVFAKKHTCRRSAPTLTGQRPPPPTENPGSASILCEMNKTSKGGQKVGYDIRMAYYLTLTAHIQVLSTCKII